MNKIPLLLLKKNQFHTLLKTKANNDISLMNYLIYIGLTINFEEFKAANLI